MIKINKILCMLVTIIFCLFVIPTISQNCTVQAASKIKLSATSKTMIKGTTYTLKVKNTKKKVKWSSNNKKIATVSSKGKVTAKGKGTTTIKAKVSGKTYSCKVKVETPSISKTKITVTKGKTYTLKMNGTKQKVTWSSSSKKIAIVNSKGKITAVKKGTTTIKAKVGGKTYSCKVVVQEPKKNRDIFEDYYKKAEQKMKKMTVNEKIGQLFLVRFPEKSEKEILRKYQFGGYLFFAKDFKGKTKSQVVNRMKELQKAAKVPILTAVDEEGGTVVRVSSNTKLVNSRFKSPMDLYKLGKFDRIKQDTIQKSKVLSGLGINLNLAPVVDVSTSSKDYMYKRTLGRGTSLTSTYAKTVISSSKGRKVSYTLKHFPGYGNNVDTHIGKAVDKRSYKDIVKNDLPPFKAGIEARAEAVLVSHNVVTSIDKNNPASLSKKVHELLRKDLKFTGIIITDAIDMGAVANDKNATVKALQAGNDLIITTDYKASIDSVKNALKAGKLNQKTINQAVRRILAWKYYKGMM